MQKVQGSHRNFLSFKTSCYAAPWDDDDYRSIQLYLPCSYHWTHPVCIWKSCMNSSDCLCLQSRGKVSWRYCVCLMSQSFHGKLFLELVVTLEIALNQIFSGLIWGILCQSIFHQRLSLDPWISSANLRWSWEILSTWVQVFHVVHSVIWLRFFLLVLYA